jgi:RimJ/RimL family protein N-acetyltransferase
MLALPELSTPRLRMRAFADRDREAFAQMHQDPQVMEHLPDVLSRDESDALMQRIQEAATLQGFGLWALESRSGGSLLGFTGLAVPSFKAAFTPCVEIGWRLARPYWGQGFATEAAEESLRFAFVDLLLPEVVSFTVEQNQRSRAVMERLGMHHDPGEDFDHPRFEEGHRLRRHWLYRLQAEQWQARREIKGGQGDLR